MWQICIRYPNGQEKAICVCKTREIALKKIDAIYSQGYPLHVAYVARPGDNSHRSAELSLNNTLKLA